MFEEMVGKSENQKVNLDHLQNNTASMICDADVLDGLKSGIKECPVCHARCFADMDVCYGCLHVFSAEENCAAKAKIESEVRKELGEDFKDQTRFKNQIKRSEQIDREDQIASQGLASSKEKAPSSSENQMVFASTDQGKNADLFEIVIKVRLPEGGNYSASLSSKNESTASSIASVVPEIVSLKRMGSESSSAKP